MLPNIIQCVLGFLMPSLLPIAAFMAAFGLHAASAVLFKNSACGTVSWVSYMEGGDVYLGFSIGLGVAFTAWSLRRFLSSRSKSAVAGAAGGSAVVAGIAAAGCFLSGCCGSPMLIVYASIFGLDALQVPKWLRQL